MLNLSQPLKEICPFFGLIWAELVSAVLELSGVSWKTCLPFGVDGAELSSALHMLFILSLFICVLVWWSLVDIPTLGLLFGPIAGLTTTVCVCVYALVYAALKFPIAGFRFGYVGQ